MIQAKSKRLTVDARSGDLSKIKDDFRSSVQAAYDQAVRFIELLMDGAKCEVGPGEFRSFKELVRVFPVVVLSDHFPSLTYLTNHLIVRHAKYSPVVCDIFLFDVLAQLLPHPVDVLYYLQQRSRFFDRIIADSEFDLLGYHMAQKLYVPDDCDFMSIDKSFGGDINDYFAAREMGASSRIEFRRLEERVEVPIVANLVSALKAGPPEVAGTAIELLDFSQDALRRLADTITMVQEEVKAGKPFKAFSVETHFGGVSYVAVAALSKKKHRHSRGNRSEA